MAKQFRLQQTILQQKLAGFGLNPKDWTLIRVTESLYHIVSREASPMIFRGWTTLSNPLQWREISVCNF